MTRHASWISFTDLSATSERRGCVDQSVGRKECVGVWCVLVCWCGLCMVGAKKVYD